MSETIEERYEEVVESLEGREGEDLYPGVCKAMEFIRDLMTEREKLKRKLALFHEASDVRWPRKLTREEQDLVSRFNN